jgi:hypothetical protein
MNNNELMQLAEMFDAIVNSDNPAVQRSLQHTMVLAKLAEEKQNIEGPFLKVFRLVDELRSQMQSLRRSVQILENNIENNSDPYKSLHTSIVDLNMNSGVPALSTIQISALTTGADTFSDAFTLEPISIDLTEFSIDDRIKF